MGFSLSDSILLALSLKKRFFSFKRVLFNRQKMAKALRKLNIPVTVILDAAVG